MKYSISFKDGKSNINEENPGLLAWISSHQEGLNILNNQLDNLVLIGEWDGTNFTIERIEGIDELLAFCYLENANLI